MGMPGPPGRDGRGPKGMPGSPGLGVYVCTERISTLKTCDGFFSFKKQRNALDRTMTIYVLINFVQ